MQILYFVFLSLMLRYTQLPNHTDVYKPLHLSDSTSMINNSSNYIYGKRSWGSLVRAERERGRGWMSERGDDMPRVRMTSKAAVAVSESLLLTKCSTKAGKGMCVCVCVCV